MRVRVERDAPLEKLQVHHALDSLTCYFMLTLILLLPVGREMVISGPCSLYGDTKSIATSSLFLPF